MRHLEKECVHEKLYYSGEKKQTKLPHSVAGLQKSPIAKT